MTDESQEYESGWPVLRAVDMGHADLRFIAVTDGGGRCSVHALDNLIVERLTDADT